MERAYTEQLHYAHVCITWYIHSLVHEQRSSDRHDRRQLRRDSVVTVTTGNGVSDGGPMRQLGCSMGIYYYSCPNNVAGYRYYVHCKAVPPLGSRGRGLQGSARRYRIASPDGYTY